MAEDSVFSDEIAGSETAELIKPILAVPPSAPGLPQSQLPSIGLQTATLDALVAIDSRGTVLGWNPAAVEMFGYKTEHALGRSLPALVAPQGQRSRIERLLIRARPRELELTLQRADGRTFPAHLTPATDGDSHSVQIWTIRDTSYRVDPEERLRQVEARFRSLVEQFPAVVFTDLADTHFTPIYVSPQIEQLLGYTPEEWLADPALWEKSLHPDDRDWVLHAALTDDAEVFELVYRMVHRNGSEVWVREQTIVIRDESGNPQFYQGMFFDITDEKLAEERLRDAERRFRTLVEQAPAITYQGLNDPDGSIVYVSPQIEAILGYKPEEWTSNPAVWNDLVHPEDRVLVRKLVERTTLTGEPFNLEYRMRASDGHYVWLQSRAELMRDENGEPLHWLGVLIDISHLKAVEADLDALRDRYRHFVESAHDAIIAYDLNGRYTFVNPAFCAMTGYSDEELRGLMLFDLIHPEDRPSVRRSIRSLIAGEPPSRGKRARLITKDGHTIVAESSASIIRSGGEVVGIQAIIRDVTERVRLEEALAFQAYHDELTGLPNRTQLFELLQQRDEAEPRAIFFVDLDNFKFINDSLGHDIGDQALIEVGKRLLARVGDRATVSRFGGDEFVILARAVEGDDQIEDLARQVLASFEEPFTLNGRQFAITASVGIAASTGAGESYQDLLRRADLAMYRGKMQGKNRFAIHDDTLDEAARHRLDLENDLRRAVRNREFTLLFQPIFDATRGRIAGVEALVRWRHPERGLLAPGEFIAVAEEIGVITEIDRWVLAEALRHAGAWPREPESDALMLSINVSARQFEEPGLVDLVRELLAWVRPGLQIVLEVTETAMMQDVDAAREIMNELAQLGVRFAIDDFGMGYSSLAQIRRFPVGMLKIDQHFVSGLSDSPGDVVIVSGMIEIAHALGMRVVAEGVESAGQLRLLSNLGCDLAQGFHFSPPVDPGTIKAMLGAATRRTSPAPSI